MKNLNEFFEEDLNMMVGFIHGYLGKNAEKLNAMQGYQLGVLTCNFSFYGILLRAEKRGETLSEDDHESMIKLTNIVDSFEGLKEYLMTSYVSTLEVIKLNDPDQYYSFMNSRGSHEAKHRNK